ncbi:hypothetical protein BDV95DRAFT_502740 [Massariosphaeria phaeospora]|uniref:DUF7728 domain-containing protein n=1 Tax=Massariosphaeria phaeospora TaxID=100035 RepID=A0A7C8I534_9PLEO|nr:hypothetical protein BDV95DRAFT_502740 [Massariosphaeria phaeospora]
MYVRNLGLCANLALVASAVLIPPTINDFGDDNAMETLAVNPFKRTLALECPSCPFAIRQGDILLLASETGNTFLLDFEVGANEDSLNIDGTQLYPPTFAVLTEPFYVTQVDPRSDAGLRLRVTGYEFQYSGAETVSEAGMELLPMTFQITSIESTPVHPPAITINILKDTEGRLMIASFEAAKSIETSPIEQEKECKEWPLLCKWRSILSDKIHGMKQSMGKGCHKNKGNPMAQEGAQGEPEYAVRPDHPHHANHEGHHHHAHHHGHMFLRRAFFTVLVPILIGIFVGTLTYLVGMALGCLVAILVGRARGQSAYARVALDDNDDDAGDVEAAGEKQVYTELPDYDAPPVYEEATEKEVVAPAEDAVIVSSQD